METDTDNLTEPVRGRYAPKSAVVQCEIQRTDQTTSTTSETMQKVRKLCRQTHAAKEKVVAGTVHSGSHMSLHVPVLCPSLTASILP